LVLLKFCAFSHFFLWVFYIFILYNLNHEISTQAIGELALDDAELDFASDAFNDSLLLEADESYQGKLFFHSVYLKFPDGNVSQFDVSSSLAIRSMAGKEIELKRGATYSFGIKFEVSTPSSFKQWMLLIIAE
jgi:hypothetical protein